MKRTYLFIGISSLALLIVLVIQVNWILKSAQIKEELFNEKANMVLSRTTEALSTDTETCRKIGACVANDNNLDPIANLGKAEARKIDSLFTYYMNFYNFEIKYSFVVTKQSNTTTNTFIDFENFSYNKPFGELMNKDKIELKLIFPDKRQFIIAEMGPMFITSIILILVVLILFWRTVLSLLKEKKISEHTADFLNNMTHEFKTPLSNIALATKMIKKNLNAATGDKTHHYTDIILAENKKLSLQVEQVLGMTALERGEIPLRKSELDCHEIILEAINCFSLQIEKQEGKIHFHPEAGNAQIMGDKIHLTNAFCNLLDNAIKYSDTKPEILIQTSHIGQLLFISLSDKGIGIDKEYQQKVFDKFFRVPTGDVHDVKGFGLGLAYLKKIVELHGGSIELQSEKGKGSTFTITLPTVHHG